MGRKLIDCSIDLNVSPHTVHRMRPHRAILACAAHIHFR
jgi:hypothetical protein